MIKPSVRPSATMNVLKCAVLLAVFLQLPSAWAQGPPPQPTLYPPPSMLVGTIAVGNGPSVVAINPSTHKVYVCNETDETLSVIDGLSLKVITTLPIGTGFHALAVNPTTNRVYVLALGSGVLLVVDGSKDTLVAEVTVQSAPDSVVVDSGTNTIYVANNASNTVSVVNGATNTVTATLNAGSHPEAMALNYVNHKLYIASYDDGTVTVIDTAHGNATTTVSGLGLQQYAIAVDPNTDSAFVLSESSGTVTRISGSNGYATLTYTNLSEPFSVAVDPGSAIVMTGDIGDNFVEFLSGSNDNRVDYDLPMDSADAMAFDPVTKQAVIASHTQSSMVLDVNLDPSIFIYSSFATGNKPFAVAVDPVTHRSFISNQADGTLTVLDGTAQQLQLTPSSVTMQATAVDVNAVTNTLYFVNPLYQTVTSVSETERDGGGHLLSVTIPVGSDPSNVAVNPVTNKIYVPNLGDGTISVIDGDTNAVSQVSGLRTGAAPAFAAVNPSTNRIYVEDNEFSTIYVIDGSTDSVITTLNSGPCDAPMTINPLTNKIYIPCSHAGGIVIVDELSGQITTISLHDVAALAINPQTNQIFALVPTNPPTVTVIDGGSNQVTGTFSTLYSATGIAVNPLTNKVYVIADNSNDGSGHTLAYDGTTFGLLEDIESPHGPIAITVNPLSNKVYVAGTNNNYLTVIDGASEASEILFTDGTNLISTGGSDALAVDLALDIVSAAGYGEVNSSRPSVLYLPTPVTPPIGQVPVTTTLQGVVDANTIATVPLYRTKGTTVTFALTAQSNYTNPAMVPQQIFYQLDGWLGTWKTSTLTSSPGANPATANATLNTLTGGLHYLYAYVVFGDGATVHGSTFAESSSVISPTKAVVFSVEPAVFAAQIAVFSGSNQTANLNTLFTAPLVALVTDGNSQPLPGASVSFSAPVSGASATFGGLTSATAVTDNSGKATSPIPTANGTAGTYTVTATVSGASAPANFTLSNANGGVPAVTLSPTSLNLGSVALGASSPAKNVKLTNSGTGPLNISSVVMSGDYSQTNNCPGTLAPSGFCTISVSFTPTITSVVPGALTLGDNAATSPQVVTLTGTGVTSLSLKPANLNFGVVKIGTTSPTQTLSVTNNTSGALSLSFSASTEYSASGGGTSPCGTTLSADATCTLSVSFKPEQNGAIGGSVSVTSPSLPAEVASLAGSGTGGINVPPVLSPASLKFSKQVAGTTSAPQTVTVTNAGATTVTILSLTSSSNFTAAGSGTSPCGGSLAAHAKCTFAVSFAPSVTAAINGSVAIANTSPISTLIYNVSGTGVNAVTLSPATLTFAGQTVGTTSLPQTITLTNNQSITLTIGSVGGSGDYTVASGGSSPCGTSVLAGSSCTLQVTFTPTSKGTINGAVTVSHNAKGSPQMVGLTGTGQ